MKFNSSLGTGYKNYSTIDNFTTIVIERTITIATGHIVVTAIGRITTAIKRIAVEHSTVIATECAKATELNKANTIDIRQQYIRH